MVFTKILFKKNFESERGFVLVVTLVTLILASLILIAAMQSSTLNILISQNFQDRSQAANSASACEKIKIKEILEGAGPSSLTPKILQNPDNTNILCEAGVPMVVEENFKIPGASSNITTVDLRFRTVGQSRRRSKVVTYTDVTRLTKGFLGGGF